MQRELECTEVISIIRRYFDGESQLSLASEYGVSEKAIYNVIRLVTYKECSLSFIKSMYGSTVNYDIAISVRKTQGRGRKI
jgi:hypothetical protein